MSLVGAIKFFSEIVLFQGGVDILEVMYERADLDEEPYFENIDWDYLFEFNKNPEKSLSQIIDTSKQ